MIGNSSASQAGDGTPMVGETSPGPRVQLLPSVTPTVADAVSDMLRDAILEGRFAPGARLVEANLARELQVSRGSVREGLAVLAKEGLVITLPRHGKFVQPLDASTIDEVYSLRRVLEPFAASRVVGSLDDDSRRQLQQAFNSIVDAVKSGDVVVVAHQDIAFHEQIFLLAHHARLVRVWKDIRGMLQIMFNVTTATHLSLGEAVEQHHLILETLLARDAKTVAGIIEQHIDSAWERAHAAMLQADRQGP